MGKRGRRLHETSTPIFTASRASNGVLFNGNYCIIKRRPTLFWLASKFSLGMFLPAAKMAVWNRRRRQKKVKNPSKVQAKLIWEKHDPVNFCLLNGLK